MTAPTERNPTCLSIWSIKIGWVRADIPPIFRPYCPLMNLLSWHITSAIPLAAAGNAVSSMAIVKLPLASPTSIAIDAEIVWQLDEPTAHDGLPVCSGQTLLHRRRSGSDKNAQPPAVSINAIAAFEPGHCVWIPPMESD